MTTAKPLTTRTQVLRAFRALLAACDMNRPQYIEVLRRVAELAEELADDELVVQRIYAVRAMEEARLALQLRPDATIGAKGG